jgi:cephalosporin-C deacetylase-like acetyl esterase
VRREDVEFQASDGTTLRGWHYRPAEVAPVVVLSHGFGAVREMYLDVVAEGLAEAGLGCLVYDHRGLGASDGEPRGELDPFAQVADMRDAITAAQLLPGADPSRIGLWGSSYSGGHVLVVGATDRRVRCVVAQVPTISGRRNTLRRFPGDELSEARERWAQDRRARMRGEAPARMPVVSGLDGTRAVGGPAGNDFAAWIAGLAPSQVATWRNEMTLRSQELYAAYEPGAHIAALAPTPLLVIAMREDTVTPTDEILAAYACARETKRLELWPGGHFDVYGTHLSAAVAAAREWFVEHL